MKTPAKATLPQIPLDARSPIPLWRQLYERLRQIVVHADQPGAHLPSTRALATALGVSRNTVLCAYEELAADQLVSAKTGSGTRMHNGIRTVHFLDPDGHPLYCRGIR